MQAQGSQGEHPVLEALLRVSLKSQRSVGAQVQRLEPLQEQFCVRSCEKAIEEHSYPCFPFLGHSHGLFLLELEYSLLAHQYHLSRLQGAPSPVSKNWGTCRLGCTLQSGSFREVTVTKFLFSCLFAPSAPLG